MWQLWDTWFFMWRRFKLWFWGWRWWHHATPECWYPSVSLHGIASSPWPECGDCSGKLFSKCTDSFCTVSFYNFDFLLAFPEAKVKQILI